MAAIRQWAKSVWAGFLLLVFGFLIMLTSYFLLPLFVSTFCFDTCQEPITPYAPTAWESSMRFISSFWISPLANSFALLIQYLPIVTAAVIVGSGITFLARPRHVLITWIFRWWLVGLIALGVGLPFLSIYSHPGTGYFGMLVSFGLFWAGNRLIRAAHPEL